MTAFNFEYFCGANVTLRLGNLVVLECAGISYETNVSKRPIYGYNSIHFDGVANGQKIVQGTLLINYVHEDYLFRMLEMYYGLDPSTKRQLAASSADTTQEGFAEVLQEQASTQIVNNSYVDNQIAKYWGGAQRAAIRSAGIHNSVRPVDISSAPNLRIIFGEQDTGYGSGGETGVLLEAVHFTGESKVISVSEETIVEAYTFFARNTHSIRTSVVPLEDFDFTPTPIQAPTENPPQTPAEGYELDQQKYFDSEELDRIIFTLDDDLLT